VTSPRSYHLFFYLFFFHCLLLLHYMGIVIKTMVKCGALARGSCSTHPTSNEYTNN
jgi:hypothetical protein